MRENLFVFHKEDTTAVCSNPDNIVAVLINTHYIFGFESFCLLKIGNRTVFVDNAQACCCADIVFAGFSFQSNPDLVTYKTFVGRPGFYCFSVIKNLARLCIAANKYFIIRSNFYMSDTQIFCIAGKGIFFKIIILVAVNAIVGSSPDSSILIFINTVYGNTYTAKFKFSVCDFSNAVSVSCKPDVVFSVLNDFIYV